MMDWESLRDTALHCTACKLCQGRHHVVFGVGNPKAEIPPQNRDPEQEEIAACMGYLRNQVALIRPKIIVCVGRIAAMTLIQPDYKVTRQHGEWIQKNGVWMMGTFHPAALLRNPYNTKNGFADFLSLREKIQELGIKI